MSRLAATLWFALSLTLTFGHPIAAQRMRHSTAPMIDAPGVGARSADAVDSVVAVAASNASPSLRATPVNSDAIIMRREQFKNVGGLVGTFGSMVWAYEATKGDLEALPVACMAPFIALLGHTVGGALGYGVSFAFYPPQRGNR